jgi:cytochrome o ubiquinol oxidase operon protein cyoD
MTHEVDSHSGASHVSTGKYMIGFGLAIVLTLISFGIVAAGTRPISVAVVGLVIAAVIQILVHLHYFLHLDRSKEKQWDFISIAFTALILVIFIAGTVWVIFSLNSRLM